MEEGKRSGVKVMMAEGVSLGDDQMIVLDMEEIEKEISLKRDE